MLLIFLGNSCKRTEQQLRCLEGQTEQIKDTKEYRIVKRAFRDTLDSWIKKDLEYIGIRENEERKLDDVVFFNSNKDKCILLLLDRTINQGDTIYDEIKMILGVKKNEEWHFYFKSMPVMGAYRKHFDRTEPFTFEELSEMAKKKIIKGGYYKKGTCKIDDEYVNGWYDKWMEKGHEEFLKSGNR